MSAGGGRVRIDRGDQHITVGLRRGETREDVQRDIDGSLDFVARMVGEGTEAWHGYYRWWGPVKMLAYKEVGPPPWPWPKVGIQPSENRRFVRFIAGWRSTAYALCFLWAGRHA